MKQKNNMRICLVNYEENYGIKDGILTKFAVKMDEELKKLGEDSFISKDPDSTADVNHHINYLPYKWTDTINTLMITHLLDNKKKMALLDEHMKTADMGICMSKDMMAILPYPKKKLTYVLPAHSGEERRPLVIAILTKVYADGCKREHMLEKLCESIDKKKFVFRVMGDGWKPILEKLKKKEVMIDYVDHFDRDMHKLILDTADYYLYFGMDEGSMGTMEAINAGVKTIVPPVGFHTHLNIDYPFINQTELNIIFKNLEYNSVKNMTWKHYAKEHLNIWKKLYDKA